MNDPTRRKCGREVEVVGPTLCLIQAYGPNSRALYLKFEEEISCALRRVKTNEPTIILRDFNADVGNDTGVWKGV